MISQERPDSLSNDPKNHGVIRIDGVDVTFAADATAAPCMSTKRKKADEHATQRLKHADTAESYTSDILKFRPLALNDFEYLLLFRQWEA